MVILFLIAKEIVRDVMILNVRPFQEFPNANFVGQKKLLASVQPDVSVDVFSVQKQRPARTPFKLISSKIGRKSKFSG